MFFLRVCLCTTYMRGACRTHREPQIPWPKVIDGHEPSCGFWALNSGPLKEQQVLLTAELSLQPQHAAC